MKFGEVVIDGGFGEGGGQIVRVALSLAAITRKKMRVVNIRAKRPNPGLRPQHLKALEAVATISGGTIEGLSIGSKSILFNPSRREITGGEHYINIGTAGSITLVIQCILPVLVFADKESNITLIGGTDVRWSPTSDYMREVFIKNLRFFGVKAEIDVVKRGYYPRGGGKAILYVKPIRKIKSINFKRDKLRKVTVISVCSNLPRSVAERQAKAALKRLEESEINVDELNVYSLGKREATDKGTSILVYGEQGNGLICGGDAIGERGKPAERVGEEAADRFLKWFKSKASVDVHLGDMLVPYVSLADSISNYTIQEKTGHLISSLYVQDKIVEAKYELDKVEENLYLLRVKGIGFTA